jgi:hypothetical protein
MKGLSQPLGRHYSFEFAIEINSFIHVAAGELAELFLDALLDIDSEGKLFSGLTHPKAGERILSCSMTPLGYRLKSEPDSQGHLPSSRYNACAKMPNPSDQGRALKAALDSTAWTLADLLKEQRLLLFLLRGFATLLEEGIELSSEDANRAQALLRIAMLLAALHEAKVKPHL